MFDSITVSKFNQDMSIMVLVKAQKEGTKLSVKFADDMSSGDVERFLMRLEDSYSELK